MRTTLLTIPWKIGGIPLFGLGIVTGLWVVFSLFMFFRNRTRNRTRNADTHHQLGQLAIALVIAAALYLLPAFMSDGIKIRGYGLFLMLGASCGIFLTAWRGRKVGVSPDAITNMCFWMIVVGIVSARLFYVVQYWSDFSEPTWGGTIRSAISYSKGGLVVYGSLIGGAAAFFYYAWRNKMPALALADLLAPGVAIGIALGRLGCFMNGCCYGGTCDSSYAVQFPKESPVYSDQLATGEILGLSVRRTEEGAPSIVDIDANSPLAAMKLRLPLVLRRANGFDVSTHEKWLGLLARLSDASDPLTSIESVAGEQVKLNLSFPKRSLPVHPSQLYSAAHAFALCFVLWMSYPFRRRDGQTMALLITLYPIGRFMLEMLRTDEAQIGTSGLTISQWISVMMLVIAAGIWTWIGRRPASLALPLGQHDG